MTAPVFYRRSFSPDVIIPFENLDTGRQIFLDISQGFFLNSLCVCCYGGNYHKIYSCA